MELTLGPEPKFSAATSSGEEKELAPILSKIFQIILTAQAEAWYLRACRQSAKKHFFNWSSGAGFEGFFVVVTVLVF